MRGFLTILAALTFAVAGCAGPMDGTTETDLPPTETAATTPTLFDWTGHVIASEIETPTHFRPTEDALWPVFQEGILFSVDAVPEAMEVALEWSGEGEFMIMLHSHKGHGTNVYTEHITELDGVNPKCLRVPTADLTEGPWQVMVHSEGAVDIDFTLHIGLVGGAGHILEDERHGHWAQDGTFAVDVHAIEPCAFLL